LKRLVCVYVLFFLVITFPAFSKKLLKPGPARYVPDEILIKFKEGSAESIESTQNKNNPTDKYRFPESLEKLGRKYKFTEVRPLFRNFKKNRNQIQSLIKEEKRFLTNKQARILKRLKRAEPNVLCPSLDRIYKLKVELSAGQSLTEVLEAVKSLADVEYAELNHIVSAHLIPNDPLYSLQWSLPKIEAPGAWDIITDGSSVVVAVLDTGVAYAHPDIDGNMWINEAEYNGLADFDDDGNGYKDDIYGYDFANDDGDPNDDNGHGSHCAGVIAGEGNNGVDITGLCWQGRIMALKFLNQHGIGSDSDAIEGIYYAVENGADIISNSWGGPFPSLPLKEALDYARSQGVILVASAGNDYSPYPSYPAGYEGVISVAATDYDDVKAAFSNYGEWVDIAAPGVDILSLWKDGGMAFASGTSMSCPHVSGTCALMLSIFPDMSYGYLLGTLMEAADPMEQPICKSGRLNTKKALLGTVSPTGIISFNQELYNCSDTIKISLMDLDLRGTGTHPITIKTDGGDFESVTLIEQGATGIFGGEISTEGGPPVTHNGTLELSHNNIITATYFDADDGTGSSTTVSATALADCLQPLIFNVKQGFPGRQPRINFETDEPTTALVKYASNCGGPYTVGGTDTKLATMHKISLGQIEPETEYFFIIEAADSVGNEVIDDNDGSCYRFLTTGTDTDIYVPSECSTIQEAIENCWDGRTVRVADGTYKGQDNRDIDFLGRTIRVQSENGPDNCIIDCNGSETGPHQGFMFVKGEDCNSVIDGFTIMNGFTDYGGAIFCEESSPKILNCVFINNYAAAIGNIFNSSPVITNCEFISNTGGGIHKTGGGISNYMDCSPEIRYCRFINNHSYVNGGGISNEYDSHSIICDCEFMYNSAQQCGGAIYFLASHPEISNCYIYGNEASRSKGGGIACKYSIGRISNCVISNNKTGGGFYCYDSGNPTISNCLISGNQSSHFGGGFCISISNPMIKNCTITGNKARYGGGGFSNYYSRPTISNCIIRDNAGDQGNNIYQSTNCFAFINYTEIENDEFSIFNEFSSFIVWGPGNLQSDPMFVSPGKWVDINNPDRIVEPSDPNAVWMEGDYHLLEESACINAGDPNYVPESNETDLDGRDRILLGRIDMGCYEFNHIPVADAGDDITAYAWIDGKANVTLDGSGSYDEDGHQLSYRWSWAIGPNTYEANGVNPTIELPVGRHIIELVVNDSSDDSEPDQTTVTVIGPLQCKLWTMPSVINRKSGGRFIITWLQLPPLTKQNDIDDDYPLTMYPGEIEATRQFVFTNMRKGLFCINILAFFDRRDFTEAAGGDERVRLDVAGRLNSGQYFYGHRLILIINRGR
jgi:parallel beta-helix repeat protein